MYALMIPVTITIDDRLPFKKDSDRTLYASVGRDKSVWGPLFEKAFAKFHGSYEAINGGDTGMAVNTIAGAPGYRVDNRKTTVDKLWDLLVKEDRDDTIITTGAPVDSPHGIVGGHAYSVIKTVKLSNGTRLV